MTKVHTRKPPAINVVLLSSPYMGSIGLIRAQCQLEGDNALGGGKPFLCEVAEERSVRWDSLRDETVSKQHQE